MGRGRGLEPFSAVGRAPTWAGWVWSPLCPHILTGAPGIILGGTDGRSLAQERQGHTLPNGPVTLADSLSQPICPPSPTDSVLVASVTAQLSAQGCSPLGIRGENPEAKQILAR